ncbi:hypothetical protein EYF80_004219 [Liparis tanakae]|uniref:Uncharacterized protein n=1 Tax=Liparis tanakae TaxID=230148 RepID=A0A4Z2J5W7_9TELE|nr:hypothetical protein EYF80_004219 [Liparis tanakae]
MAIREVKSSPSFSRVYSNLRGVICRSLCMSKACREEKQRSQKSEGGVKGIPGQRRLRPSSACKATNNCHEYEAGHQSVIHIKSASSSDLVDEEIQTATMNPVKQVGSLHLLVLKHLASKRHQQPMQPLESLAQHALGLGPHGGRLRRGATGAVSYRATEKAEGEQLLVEGALLLIPLLLPLCTAAGFWRGCWHRVRNTDETDREAEHLFDLPQLRHMVGAQGVLVDGVEDDGDDGAGAVRQGLFYWLDTRTRHHHDLCFLKTNQKKRKYKYVFPGYRVPAPTVSRQLVHQLILARQCQAEPRLSPVGEAQLPPLADSTLDSFTSLSSLWAQGQQPLPQKAVEQLIAGGTVLAEHQDVRGSAHGVTQELFLMAGERDAAELA